MDPMALLDTVTRHGYPFPPHWPPAGSCWLIESISKVLKRALWSCTFWSSKISEKSKILT
jgi:hypothetical protein